MNISSSVDLTNCDREPIHIPGMIQPYGALLALDENALTINQASDNTASLLGLPPEPALVGQTLAHLWSDAECQMLREALGRTDAESLDQNPTYLFRSRMGAQEFDWIAHRSQDVLVLEAEPILSADGSILPRLAGTSAAVNDLIKRAVPRLQSAPDAPTLHQIAAEEVRRLTGFDRVMIYRFAEDGHGLVIAENKRDDLEPFFGLHYPASDIPQQARRLYLLNRLRLIADVSYTPSPVLPAANPQTNAPLDMSYCFLRSVSPIHIQYLKNMQVGASLSISLVHQGALWGLIACHHLTPRRLSYEERSACELLGQVVSLQLESSEDRGDAEYREQIHAVRTRLVEQMAVEKDYRVGLHRSSVTARDLINSSGFALYTAGESVIRIGATPTEDEIERIVSFLTENRVERDVFVTDALPSLLPEAGAFQTAASGMIALPVSRNPRGYLLWFRPEVAQTVDWAGDPNKAVTVAADGTERLSPRGSFTVWREAVRGRSLPWKPVEIEAVRSLQRSVTHLILNRAEEIARLNADLSRSNAELDSFAYIASHDLKEPLRGIHNYAQFIQEDHSDILPEEANQKLNTLMRLTQRMDSLIDSLLHYSRLGRQDLELQPVDLNEALQWVLESLRMRLNENGIEIRVPRPLPNPYRCDFDQASEVFHNLISNGAKYNDKPEKWIEIGYIAPGETDSPASAANFSVPVFCVRDNGLGIPASHFSTIFQLFRRLHGRNEYGGGTGAGLAIVQTVVERHRGTLWLESVIGEGTTFYFTLATNEQ